jgi:cation diffusion facilitator family transporter
MSSPGQDKRGSGSSGLRTVLAALAANLGIAITKLIAFLLTGSASLLAEFVHSLADCSDQVLLLIGRNRAARGETEEHPFGYGPERYFYGFIVSVVLFTVGGAYSIYDGIHKILHPDAITNPLVAFGVLIAAAVMEGFSLRTAIRESNQQRGRRGWGEFIRRTKVPDLIIILLEDSAALTGLIFAFAGVGLSEVTGNGAWDGAGSVAIGLLLALVAVVVAVEMKSLLIGESASPEALQTIVNALEDGPELEGVIHMRTVHLGPDSLLVAAKVAVRADEPAAEVVRGIDIAEGRVRGALPIAHVIYLEPDIYREERVDQTDPAIRAVERASRRRRTRRPGRPPGPGAGPAQPGPPSLPLRARQARRTAEEPQRPFLLEVEGPPRLLGYPAQAPAKVGHGRADGGLGQDAQAERERRRADLVPPLQVQGGGDGAQVRVAELPVGGPAPGPVGAVPHRRQEAQIPAVTEHPGRHPEAPGRFRYTHRLESYILL